MERKWMVGLEIQFHSFKKPIVFWSTDGKKGVSMKNEEGVQVFCSQESEKATIHVLARVHVSILLIRFQLFPSPFWGFKDNNSNNGQEREFLVLLRRNGVFGPLIDCFHCQFPLVCTRILTTPID